MDFSIETLAKIKKGLIMVSSFSLIWFFIAIFFIDARWWWFILELVVLGVGMLYFHKKEVYALSVWRNRIQYTIGVLAATTLLFVFICAIFITAWWWFGLLIVFVLVMTWVSFYEENKENLVSAKEKKVLSIFILSAFMISFCLFCIPSFVANSHKNPPVSFGSSYNAVDAYMIYGVGLSDTEHIAAKSWLKNNNYANDYVNIIKANKFVNNQRGDLMFGEVKKNKQNAISVNIDDEPLGYKDIVSETFMPTDEYKGDVARIILYMYVTYKDDGFPVKKIDINLMKKWSKNDPVDSRERERNNLIKDKYKYENIFVSIPWLIGFIV
ncbi:MAG TPA: endonuclease [Bacilli bacterium]|nr:endonuclease [Bacilli bacterium]